MPQNISLLYGCCRRRCSKCHRLQPSLRSRQHHLVSAIIFHQQRQRRQWVLMLLFLLPPYPWQRRLLLMPPWQRHRAPWPWRHSITRPRQHNITWRHHTTWPWDIAWHHRQSTWRRRHSTWRHRITWPRRIGHQPSLLRLRRRLCPLWFDAGYPTSRICQSP